MADLVTIDAFGNFRDDGEPTVAYHGTRHVEVVLTEGLRPDAWMALRQSEAANYGDVVAIDLTQLEGTWPRVREDEPGLTGALHWQAHAYGQAIPASALSRVVNVENCPSP